MQPNHPITRANWIWPEAYMYLYNHLAQFRRDFELKVVGKKAVLHITADKSYKLFVNGQYVCRGPARGYQAHWPFDSVDLRPYLKRGHNWISIEAYNPGISTFSYLHQTRAGLLCAPEGRELEGAWEKTQWQYRRSPAHATRTARMSVQVDFQEHVDLNADDRSWITSAQAPQGWEPRIFDPTVGHNYMGQPFGTPPYASVEERGIPMLREWLRGPAGVTKAFEGRCGEGYQTCENVSWFWYDELMAGPKAVGVPAYEVLPEWLTLRVEPTGKGKFRAYYIDLGEHAAANLIIEADGAAGGEVLDFQYDQRGEDGGPKMLKPGDGCLAAMSSRLKLRPGQSRHEFYHLVGYQHLTLIARDITQPITLKIQLRCAGYPFTFTGRFVSSDQTLNQIRAACQRTQQLCAWDAYMDTPWREQAQWWGDARVQARNTFYMDGDARLLARGIRSVAGQLSPQGLTYGHAPTSSDWCILPDFALTWILTNWDYYYQTGDISLFVEQLPTVQKILAYFRSAEAVGKLGLLQYDRRFWLFEDWSTLPKQHYPCFLNLWYLLTLRHVEKMAAAARMKPYAAEIARLANAQEKLLLKHFFDPKMQVLRPALDEKGKPQGEPSVHDQTMALMLNLVPKAHAAMMDQVLLPFLRGQEIPGAKASAFWSFYTLEEMGQRGFGKEVMEFIRRGWTPMLQTGTTWEEFSSIKSVGSSNCHAWTSHPSVHFINLLCGVRQTAPAWEQITFAPIFVAGIDHVEGAVPTPQGQIEASWERKGGKITGQLKLPRGVKARIELPGQKPRVQTGGTFRFAV